MEQPSLKPIRRNQPWDTSVADAQPPELWDSHFLFKQSLLCIIGTILIYYIAISDEELCRSQSFNLHHLRAGASPACC